MSPRIRTPEARLCELCDRAETWDDDVGAWRVATTDGEPQVGSLHCIHEWDVNGSFVPFGEDPDAAEG